ncbi:MAG: tetratricopeptide repeat protein [Bacteroidetes bacterium]|nr:tetratricopeptide repeat protein [Bacteroidota bacterium]
MKYTGLYLLLIPLLFSGCFMGNKSFGDRNDSKNLSDERAKYVYTEATKLKLFGQYKQAIDLFVNYIENFPDSHGSYYQLAQIYLSQGNMVKAEENILKAREIAPDNEWYDYFLVSVYKVQGNVDALITVYEELLKDEKDDEMSYELAMLYQRKGNHKRAIDMLENLENTHGVAEEINIPKYENYLMLNKNDSAFKEINKLIRLYPDRSEYYGILAEYYLSRDDLDSAKYHYDKLFKIDSGSVQGKISYVDYLIKRKSYNKAFDLSNDVIENSNVEKRDKVELIISLLSNNKVLISYQGSVYELIKNYDATHPSEASALTLYADYYLKTGQKEDALQVLKKLIKVDRTNYLYWEQLILIENEKNNTDSVIKYSNKALEIFEKIPNLYLINGISYYYVEDYKNAVKSLQEGYNINNNKQLEQQFIIFLAECYNQLENYKQADKYFHNALERYPENYVIKNNYAYYLSLREENLDFAKKISKETIEHEPTNATFLDTYAWILYKLGKYKDAYDYIGRALKYGATDNAEVLVHCGDILVKLRKFEDALYMYKRALELDKDNQEIRSKIEKYENSK